MLHDLLGVAHIHPVIVRNGVVLYAPGALNLGRSTRLANRAQRRVLRALYPTCAIPGCEARFELCKIHHVIWWEDGGLTDLDNLLPLCSRHHHARPRRGMAAQAHPRPPPDHHLPRRHHPHHEPTSTQMMVPSKPEQ